MANEIQPSSRVVRVPASRGPANIAPAAGAMTPKEIAGIFRRHIFMIVFLTIIGSLVGGGSWYLLKMYLPGYTSIGTIEVLPPITPPPGTFVTTQPNTELFYQFRSTKAYRLQTQGFLEELLRDDDIREMNWFKKFDTIADKVEYLEGKLSASAARDLSHIVVSMTTADPEEAMKTAKEAISLFLSIEGEHAEDDTRMKLVAAQSQQKSLQGELTRLENDLQGLREGAKFSLNQSDFRDYLDEVLSTLQRESNAFSREKDRMQVAVNILAKRKDSAEFDEVIRNRVEQDQLAQNMRLKVDSIEVELKRLKSQFGDDHNRVKETNRALQEQKTVLVEWQAKIGDLIRNAELINTMDQLTMLEAQLDSQQIQLDSAREEYQNIYRVRADYEVKTAKRDEFRTKVEEMNSHIRDLQTVLSDENLSKVKSGIPPVTPLEMSSPNPFIYIPGGFVLGFMIGVGLAFAVELLNDLLRSPSEVAKHIRVPLLGTICHKSEDRTVKRLNLYHVVREAPYSIMSEAYRQFKARLTLNGSETDNKTLLITSGNPGDGKTTVAVNTAYTFAADGKRVLLIDTNFRKPSTTVLFGRSKSDGSELGHPDFGLSNYLMDQCDKDSVVRSSDHEGLDIIDSGPLPLNPSELLASDKMIDMIKTVREKYDYVIIDGPPLLVSESKILASEVDGTILVFNAAQTRRGAAQRALRELKEVNANVLGTVLVGVKSIKGGYFHETYDTYKRYQKAKPALKARS